MGVREKGIMNIACIKRDARWHSSSPKIGERKTFYSFFVYLVSPSSFDCAALTPISPFLVYAHSALAPTMRPLTPTRLHSPPIYCDLAPPNDGAYTCLQD